MDICNAECNLHFYLEMLCLDRKQIRNPVGYVFLLHTVNYSLSLLLVVVAINYLKWDSQGKVTGLTALLYWCKFMMMSGK